MKKLKRIVICSFDKISNKKVKKFTVFRIKKFYPLFKESLDFANSYVNILENDKNIINHGRKSLLFKKQQTSIKKECGLFDLISGRI